MNIGSHLIHPAQPADPDPSIAPSAARSPLALAITSLLLAGALGGEARAQTFSPVINLGSLSGSNGFRLDGAAGDDRSGFSVSAAGDINGDGIDDLIVGAPSAYSNGNFLAGSSYVVFGKSTPFSATLALSSLDGSNGFRLDGAAEYDFSGASVAAVDDINGDGIDDVIVAAFRAQPNGLLSGSSYVVFGKHTSTVGDFPGILALSSLEGVDGFRLDGAAPISYVGFSVSGAGDINGDGIDDLIVGAPGAYNGFAGSIYVLFGKKTGFPASINLGDLSGGDYFRADGAVGERVGASVSAAGDINGDGIDDLIVGARSADPNGNFLAGSSYVVFGMDEATVGGFPTTLALSDLNGSNGFRLDGTAEYDQSGFSVSGAGDINGDGIDDLIVGACCADPNGVTDSGSSYVVFGRDTASVGNFSATMALSSLDGSDGFRLDGAAERDQIGLSVASAGDINGDGIDDLIVGARDADPNGSQSGSSYVVFGRDAVNGPGFPATLALSSLDGSNGFRLDGVAAGDVSGYSVAAAGDINGDGIDDLIVGAYRADPNGSVSGSSYVVFGGTQGPGLTPGLALTPSAADFGDVELGMTATETLIVENTGTGTLSPGTLSITGPQAGEFSISLNDCDGAQLANSEFCGIDIGFAPIAPGIRQATLSLQSNAPSSPDLVQLRGSNDVVFADEFET
jgi:hypothetical protein